MSTVVFFFLQCDLSKKKESSDATDDVLLDAQEIEDAIVETEGLVSSDVVVDADGDISVFSDDTDANSDILGSGDDDTVAKEKYPETAEEYLDAADERAEKMIEQQNERMEELGEKLSKIDIWGTGVVHSSDEDAETSDGQSDVGASGSASPKIVFDELFYDFGDISDNEVVVHDFIFENQGDAPLHILEVVASCGCTVPEHPAPEDAFASGEQGKITLKFNSSTFGPGPQTKYVHVRTNIPLSDEDLSNLEEEHGEELLEDFKTEIVTITIQSNIVASEE